MKRISTYIRRNRTAERKVKGKAISPRHSSENLSYLERNDLFDEMTYFTYIGGEYRKAVVTNNMTQNSNKILMLRDSFSCTLLPFLSLACNQITAVDLRYHDNPELMQIIEDEDIDTVLVVYNPSMFREDGAFDFFK